MARVLQTPPPPSQLIAKLSILVLFPFQWSMDMDNVTRGLCVYVSVCLCARAINQKGEAHNLLCQLPTNLKRISFIYANTLVCHPKCWSIILGSLMHGETICFLLIQQNHVQGQIILWRFRLDFRRFCCHFDLSRSWFDVITQRNSQKPDEPTSSIRCKQITDDFIWIAAGLSTDAGRVVIFEYFMFQAITFVGLRSAHRTISKFHQWNVEDNSRYGRCSLDAIIIGNCLPCGVVRWPYCSRGETIHCAQLFHVNQCREIKIVCIIAWSFDRIKLI